MSSGPQKALVPNAAGLSPFGATARGPKGVHCHQGLHEHCLKPGCRCACHTPGTGRYRIPKP